MRRGLRSADEVPPPLQRGACGRSPGSRPRAPGSAPHPRRDAGARPVLGRRCEGFAAAAIAVLVIEVVGEGGREGGGWVLSDAVAIGSAALEAKQQRDRVETHN